MARHVSPGRSRGRARPLPHPELLHRCRRLVLRRAGRGRVPHRPIPYQHVPDLVRPDGRQSRAPVAPSRVAAFAYGGRPGDCRRGGTSPGQSHRDPEPRMADDPRAGTLYRRGDFRGRRVRQDFGVYAPVRAPTLELASPRSRAATGGAHPGSQGRFLSRHPRDPQRRRARSRLHRAVPRWSDYMESPERDVAGFVLARLYRGVTSESAFRQGERTILATGVHESRPLDHRTVPRAAPPPRRQRHARMGDAARRVPLCDRQGSIRQENQRGADVRPRQVRRMDHHRQGDDERRDKDFRARQHRVSTAPGAARPTPGALQSGPSEAPSKRTRSSTT